MMWNPLPRRETASRRRKKIGCIDEMHTTDEALGIHVLLGSVLPACLCIVKSLSGFRTLLTGRSITKYVFQIFIE